MAKTRSTSKNSTWIYFGTCALPNLKESSVLINDRLNKRRFWLNGHHCIHMCQLYAHLYTFSGSEVRENAGNAKMKVTLNIRTHFLLCQFSPNMRIFLPRCFLFFWKFFDSENCESILILRGILSQNCGRNKPNIAYMKCCKFQRFTAVCCQVNFEGTQQRGAGRWSWKIRRKTA